MERSGEEIKWDTPVSVPTTFRLTEEEQQPQLMLQPQLQPMLQPQLQSIQQPELQPQLQLQLQTMLQPQLQPANQINTSVSEDEGSNHIIIQDSDMDQDVLAFKVDVEGDLNS